MAVDSEEKRRAVSGALPVVDGEIDAEDRRIVSGEYPLGTESESEGASIRFFGLDDSYTFKVI
jgi:hypothetical protein